MNYKKITLAVNLTSGNNPSYAVIDISTQIYDVRRITLKHYIVEHDLQAANDGYVSTLTLRDDKNLINNSVYNNLLQLRWTQINGMRAEPVYNNNTDIVMADYPDSSGTIEKGTKFSASLTSSGPAAFANLYVYLLLEVIVGDQNIYPDIIQL